MSDITSNKNSPNRFVSFFIRLWQRIATFFIGLGHKLVFLFKRIGGAFKRFHKNFVNGSVYIKISYFIMGFNNIAKKQFIKGILFLLMQVGFFIFMSLLGINQIIGFFTLGTNVQYQIEGTLITVPGDNSMLMLLFGIITFVVVGIYIWVWLLSIKSALKVESTVKEGGQVLKFKEELKSLVNERFHTTMLTVPVIGVLVFTVLPILFMISIAFTSYDSKHLPPGNLFEWVGLSNFAALFESGNEIGNRFFPVLLWTLCWAVLATFTNYIFGIILALLINKKSIKFKAFWRTAFVITIAVPQFVTILTVRGMLSDVGPINGVLINMGMVDAMNPIRFFGSSPWLARALIIIVNMWIGIPFTLLITTGILMNIPAELYEAATVDGASVFKMFIRITMPYIVFVTTPYLITQFIGNINNFNVIYLLSGGGPSTPNGDLAGETDLLITWLYKLTVDKQDYNFGSVIGIMTFVICAIISLFTYQHTASYKKEDNFQ